jgi:phytoene/squalene synthetase
LSNIIVPSCPKDRKEIKDVIEQISNSMTRIEGEKEYQKEAFKELSERFEVDQKWLKKMATDYHKDTYSKTVGDLEDYSLLYENIIQSGSSLDDEEETE